MLTKNKEVLRIRKLKPRPPVLIHENQLLVHKATGKVKNVNQYTCPPKDFKKERFMRKRRWFSFRMWETQRSNIHGLVPKHIQS